MTEEARFIGVTSMKRFLIRGSPKFNNYYLFRKYVKEYLPENPIIVTCGGNGGTDLMAREYCEKEQIPIEEYPVEHHDQESVFRRDIQMIAFCNIALIFDAGNKGTVEHIKDSLLNTKKPTIVINIQDSDNINCNIDCTNKFLKEYFDMCKKSEYNISNLADVTLAILFHEEILKNILESKDDEYAVSENINMAAGVAWWLKHNELPYIKQRLVHEERKDTLKPIVSLEERNKIWTNKEHPVSVSTIKNLPVLTDFTYPVLDGNHLWLEAEDNNVVKNNLWQTREQMMSKDDNPINSYYETKDDSNTKVFYRNTEFDASPFRAGMWYFNTETLQ